MERITNLPPLVRMALFGVVVVAIMALGYLTLDPSETNNTDDKPSDTTTKTDSTVVNPVEPAPEDDKFVEDYTKGVELELDMPVSEEDLKVAAGKAIRFSELYLSYRYNQDDKDKNKEIQPLLAQDHAIDLLNVFPEGPIKQEFVDTQTIINTEVTTISVALISDTTLSLSLTTTTTTDTVSEQAQEVQGINAVTMTYDYDRAGWFVTAIQAQGTADPFQDESQ